MPQLATSMSVPLSCPLYLDLSNGQLQSEANFKSPFEVQEIPKSMFDMSFFYENLVKGQTNMYNFNPNLLAESFNYYLSQSCRNSDKSVSPKSFSIESILGFPNSSTPKDAFCNQLAFSDYTAKNGHCPVPEFATNPDNYRPVTGGHVFESSKAKDAMTSSESANLAHTGRPADKSLGILKHYPGLSRKSSKAFKCSAKQLSISQSKSKRVRTIFTPEQLERLETEFERQQYMVGTGRHYLASTLNLTEAQVKVWFQNRRIKWRKQHLEGQQDKNGNDEKELL